MSFPTGHERPPPDSGALALATHAIGKGLVRPGGCEDPT